jgi:adenosine deaminase
MKVALLGVCGLLAFLVRCAGRDLSAQSGPALASTTREPQVASYLERIRREPPALRAFLRALPKGADLHTHLFGAIYAES